MLGPNEDGAEAYRLHLEAMTCETCGGYKEDRDLHIFQSHEVIVALRAEVDGPFGYKATIKKLTLSVYEWEQGQMGLEKDNAALRARVEVLEEEARQVCGELGEFYGKGQGTAVEKIRFLYRDWEQRDEVWREKKRVLENDLAKEWAKIERMENDYVELHKKVARFERVACDLEIVGRIMHESWTRTKRAQGYHHPSECYAMDRYESNGPCPKCHSDLIPWEQLPEVQKDINRHAFDDVLAWLKEGV